MYAVLRALTLAIVLLLPASAALAAIVPGEVVVRFAPGQSGGAKAAALSRVGAQDTTPLAVPDTQVAQLADGADVQQAAARLEARSDVLWAEPNYVVHAAALPNDPGLNLLWGLRNTGQVLPQDLAGGSVLQAGTPGMDVDVAPVWERTTGSADILVGVVDSGVARHVDLNANLRADLSRDFTVQASGTPPDPFADSDGHGTHVAGTIGAVGDNGLGVVGVNWRVGLVSLRTLDPLSGTSAGVASAFAYAAQRGIPVVNASIGLPDFSQALEDAVALAPQTLFVVAAGNESANLDTTPSYPCSLPEANIVCVASIDDDGALSFFSNTSATKVDLGAPGNAIASTVPTYAAPDPIAVTGAWSHGGTGDAWTFDAGDTTWSTDLAPGADAWLQAPPVSLAGRRACTATATVVTAWTGEDAALLLERSPDSGATWELIGARPNASGGDPVQVTGSAKGDGQPDVRFRLRLLAVGAGAPTPGAVQVRDLSVRCLAAGDSTTYDRKSGTSMATPHVAGVAALLLAARPDLTTAQLRSALLSTAVPTPGLAGVTATGGRVDAAAALASVTPAPPTPSPGGGGGSATTPASPPAPASAPDAAPPATPAPMTPPAILRASLSPSVGALMRTGVATARVAASQTASVRVDAFLRWRGGSARLAAASRDALAAGDIATLHLRAGDRALRRLRTARADGRRIRVQLTLTATTADGGRASVTRARVLG